MPEGCDAVCVPDDLGLRIPKLSWEPAPRFGAGAERVVTTDKSVSLSGSLAVGPGPTYFTVSLNSLASGDTTDTTVTVDRDLRPVGARRAHHEGLCGLAFGPRYSDDGFASHMWLHGGPSFTTWKWFTQVLPLERIGELALTLDGRFEWPATEQRGINSHWLSSKLVAADFTGDVALGDLSTGEVKYVRELPGAAPGQYAYARLFGGTAFVKRSYGGNDWWVYTGSVLKRFVGDAASISVSHLAVDGESIVWKETRALDAGQHDVKVFSSHYTTDPAKLAPRLLLAGAPLNLWEFHVANGWFVGTNRERNALYGDRAYVIRLSDARVLTTPAELSGLTYPAADALYASADAPVRIPYESMTVIQETAPGG